MKVFIVHARAEPASFNGATFQAAAEQDAVLPAILRSLRSFDPTSDRSPKGEF